MDGLVTKKKKKHFWFHKPNEEHPEIPDLTIPRNLYVVRLDDIKYFLNYKGKDIPDMYGIDRGKWRNDYNGNRLVRFKCDVKTIIIYPSIGWSTIHSSHILLLLDKLLMHKVKTLIFKELNVDTIDGDSLYPKGKFPIRIKYLSFDRCKIGSHFLDFFTKSKKEKGMDYNLIGLEFYNSVLTYDNVTIIHHNLKTNYIIRNIIRKNTSEDELVLNKNIIFCEEGNSKHITEINNLFIEIDGYLTRNRNGYEKCKSYVLLILLAHRFSKGSIFQILGRDVTQIIAKKIWESRGTKIWCYHTTFNPLE